MHPQTPSGRRVPLVFRFLVVIIVTHLYFDFQHVQRVYGPAISEDVIIDAITRLVKGAPKDDSQSPIYEDERSGNHTAGHSLKSPLKVMIKMVYSRKDRLGSNIKRPLYLMAYSHCYGYDFCVKPGSKGLSKYFPGFLSCPDDVAQSHPPVGVLFARDIDQSGTYRFKRDDRRLKRWVDENEDCAFDPLFRSKWKEMIIDASYSDAVDNATLAGEDLFRNTHGPEVTTVAVNIRRGDFQEWGRPLIYDETYVVLIKKLRSILQKAGRIPVVHLFSENYGMIDKSRNIRPNWDLYEGIVEHFHLAPQLGTRKDPHVMDMALNLRDWRHFVTSDILVVGGTFSSVPAIGRPKSPDPDTGLPLTIYPCTGERCFRKDDLTAKYVYGWTKHGSEFIPNQFSLKNLPEVFAKFDNHTETSQFIHEAFSNWNSTIQ